MARMKLGIENIEAYRKKITNQNIGLVTNFTGMTSCFEPSYDLINKYGKVVRIFTPEHGLHGVAAAGEKTHSYHDRNMDLDIVSLYGDHQAPAADELADLDLLIFDIQDIGCRYYTYIYTMYYAMKAACKIKIPMLIMDRTLPVGRQLPMGSILSEDYYSFVGMLPLPNMYYLTIGELALWIKAKMLPSLKLQVVPLINWRSDLTIRENGLPWVSPSPNLVTFDAIRLYGGLCLIEGTNVSEGRGTVHPFEQIGAPWIDASELAAKLKETQFSAQILFQPVWFVPLSSKYQGEVCQGVRFHLKEMHINGLALGYTVLSILFELYSDKFSCNLVSPSIGTKHHFIEYLAGKKLNAHTNFTNLIEEISEPNMDFYRQTLAFHLYD